MNIDFFARTKKLEAEKRRRNIFWLRLRYGVLAIVRQPWKLIFPVLLLLLSVLAWGNRAKIPLPGGNGDPALVALWECAVALLIIMFSALLLLGLAVVLGTPPHAKKIDAALVHVDLVDCYGSGPALISSQRTKGTDIRIMEFLSYGISKEKWERKQSDIEDVLNVHYVERMRYGGRKGNNRNYIVLTVAPGAGAKRAEPLYDDER